MKLVNSFLLIASLVAAPALSPARAAGTPSDTVEFKRALKLAAQDKTKPSHKIIDRLLTKKASDIARDRLLMTKGRLLFQDGDVRGSLKYYEQIPTDSDYWLEALEERGWAHLRLGEHGEALAKLKTIKAPVFDSLVGPEPYFLTGLAHLKVCDYPAIFEAIKEFQAKFRPRLVAIQTLARDGTSAAANTVISKLRTEPLNWKAVAPEAKQLPRFFHRDTLLQKRVAELKAGKGDGSAVARRLRELARLELKEINDIVQKMHLLEAEVIQRIHMAEKPNTRANRDVKMASGETLEFPDTGEYWLDELDNYHVKVSGCPTDKTATGGQKL